jgi:DNA-directed RNA polymerase specialized sigma24 family protein
MLPLKKKLTNQQKQEIEKILSEYKSHIYNIAKYYFYKNNKNICSLEDYIQEAYLITINVLFVYDPSYGPFINYLTQSLRNGLSYLALSNNSLLSLKKKKVILATKIYKLDLLGLSVEQISKKLNISEKEVRNLKNVLKREVLSDNISYQDDKKHQDLNHDLQIILTKEEFMIYDMNRSGIPLDEIASKINRSKETVRKRIQKILKKIKPYHET